MTIKNVSVPDLGGAADATVIEINVKVGDKIAVETPLITLESDKATMEVPSSDVGVVKEIKLKVGDKVETGTVVLTLEAGEQAAAAPASKPAEPAAKPAPAPQEKAPAVQAHAPNNKTIASPVSEAKTQPVAEKAVLSFAGADAEQDEDAHAGPAVRRLAHEIGLNLGAITGSGPKQRILKEDVRAYVQTALTQAAAGGGGGSLIPQAPVVDFSKFGAVEMQALTRINKLTGKTMQRNWLLVPHVTQCEEADITELEAYRKAQKTLMDKQGIKLTPLVFIMKAVVACLQAYPRFNASLEPSGENLILKKYFHIGVAVDTPEGLVVPVIRDVDKKGLLDLAKELAVISEKARNKQLTTNDMSGGCFTISSLGGIGGTAFTPIVNVPEVAILGVSRASLKPVYQDNQFVPRLMLPLSLSYDHRVIDGAAGARFVVHLAHLLSDIRNLLL